MNEIEKAIEEFEGRYRQMGNANIMKKPYELAISALKKQVPKKVVENDEIQCPNCNTKILTYYKTTNYCVKCGQKLDFGEE
jgi:ribosomal protein S27AE